MEVVMDVVAGNGAYGELEPEPFPKGGRFLASWTS